MVIATALLCGPAAAGQVEIVLDRGDRAIEIFFGMSAETAVETFGLDPALLVGPDGTVDFGVLQQGTWGIGDALLARVDARLGSKAAGFEGTSLMVHLKDQRLPFATPMDGLAAISVCGATPPETPPVLDDLYLYAGFVAYPENTGNALRLDLPGIGPAGLEVVVREFGTNGPAPQRRLHLSPGETLVLGRSPFPWWAISLALLPVTGLGVFRWLRSGHVADRVRDKAPHHPVEARFWR